MFLLIAERRAHAADALLWVVVLGCVVMHFFMHGSRGSHGSRGRPGDDEHDDGGGAPDQ